ncbi:hypothetical protein HPY09_20995 (plasmid) [Vibrio cholerae]|uniref:hypothetical protein n=1 Tax=Vibrio cholerae TaxID=666 RepID=UPI001182BCD1|nr:hypothetical protein [Vibrio cholerae]EJL6460778.1 hypothetical protein [Vibrio cholerae]MBJ6954269.1 hypothetical protein [Vibrio cholerae]MVC22275.1 hypothetical protein [Vibrio cholerae]QKU73412.1 hypothetical protein HPY09_20995 [Vibrio cholerae]QKU77112.1 hypothetical protein HPY05_19615 [Vibrio cholerae]
MQASRHVSDYYFNIYTAGQQAYADKKGRNANPYPVLSNQRAVWESGYADSMALAREAVI